MKGMRCPSLPGVGLLDRRSLLAEGQKLLDVLRASSVRHSRLVTITSVFVLQSAHLKHIRTWGQIAIVGRHDEVAITAGLAPAWITSPASTEYEATDRERVREEAVRVGGRFSAVDC